MPAVRLLHSPRRDLHEDVLEIDFALFEAGDADAVGQEDLVDERDIVGGDRNLDEHIVAVDLDASAHGRHPAPDRPLRAEPGLGRGSVEPGAVVEPEQLRRATLASSVGSALEYYDFYIYGLASALIFGPLFFSPLAGMVPGYATAAALLYVACVMTQGLAERERIRNAFGTYADEAVAELVDQAVGGITALRLLIPTTVT